MNLRLFSLLCLCVSVAVGAPMLFGQTPPQPTDELAVAKKTGWQLVKLVIPNLKGGAEFPGIDAWLQEYVERTKGIDAGVQPEQRPQIDVDALMTHNPNFWRAHYEIAPGDPGLAPLQAGLLLTAGEATRASDLIVVVGQRPGVPAQVRGIFRSIAGSSQRVGERSSALVQEGVALFDKGDYAAALKKRE